MRIDDRKVNGCVSLDAVDPVDGFKIFINQDGAKWSLGDSTVDPAVVATHIKRVLADSRVPFVRFYVTIADTDTRTVLCQPNYTLDDAEKSIEIDIKALVSDKILSIALDTGVITFASNTIM
uniref:Uncharacterized protein n=1 Tax=Siphoviridae sp. ctCUc43 TaxID=2825379 RepID=A0A8S5QKS5_9CAUD|nr:MAG TPA: hypothetical protein [Siphoviridae sp. ctCUc43]